MAKKKEVAVNNKRRIVFVFMFLALFMTILVVRLAWIQVVKAEEYSDIAKDQQKSDIPIEARRGSIYDRSGEELAVSATCYTLWVRPAEIRSTYEDEARRNEIAGELALILDIDASSIKEKFNSDEVLLKVARYLEKSDADQVRELGISGLELAEDTKRFYPLGSFAANLLGSVTDDGIGRSGIELQYDEYLSGVAGRAVMDTDVNGNQISSGSSKYYEAEDGLNVTLTLDQVLQHYLEDAVAQGMIDTGSERISAIAMDPKTGEILACEVTPSFDPNDPTTPTDESELEKFLEMTTDEQSAYLSNMWKNPLVTDVYEPGSTLKIISSASVLDDGLVTPDTTFVCNGYYDVAGLRFYDAEHHVHGTQTVTQAFGNSCNPTHMQFALMLGMENYYEHIERFGLLEPTGVDLPGESYPIVSDPNSIGPVELASMGFGQGIAITPIQLITAVSSIGNHGIMMQPHFVSKLTDRDGNVVVEYSPKEIRKTVSDATAEEMLILMRDEVELYGGRTGIMEGYRIGGKTGTSSKVDDDTGTYGQETDTSFVCLAPIDDPQIAVLIVCNSPTSSYYADLTAIPIAKNFLTKALPYMGIEAEEGVNTSSSTTEDYAYVPDVTGLPASSAIALIEEQGLKYEIRPSLTESEIADGSMDFEIIDQYPKAGKKISKSEAVYIYRE